MMWAMAGGVGRMKFKAPRRIGLAGTILLEASAGAVIRPKQMHLVQPMDTPKFHSAGLKFFCIEPFCRSAVPNACEGMGKDRESVSW